MLAARRHPTLGRLQPHLLQPRPMRLPRLLQAWNRGCSLRQKHCPALCWHPCQVCCTPSTLAKSAWPALRSRLPLQAVSICCSPSQQAVLPAAPASPRRFVRSCHLPAPALQVRQQACQICLQMALRGACLEMSLSIPLYPSRTAGSSFWLWTALQTRLATWRRTG